MAAACGSWLSRSALLLGSGRFAAQFLSSFCTSLIFVTSKLQNLFHCCVPSVRNLSSALGPALGGAADVPRQPKYDGEAEKPLRNKESFAPKQKSLRYQSAEVRWSRHASISDSADSQKMGPPTKNLWTHHRMWKPPSCASEQLV